SGEVAPMSSGAPTDTVATAVAQAPGPLHLAAAGGQVERVKSLVEQGESTESRDEEGQTPLHYAAANGHGQTTQTLLDLGADPMALDQDEHAPRYYAELNGHNGTA